MFRLQKPFKHETKLCIAGLCADDESIPLKSKINSKNLAYLNENSEQIDVNRYSNV
jgi:hypothetical protein